MIHFPGLSEDSSSSIVTDCQKHEHNSVCSSCSMNDCVNEGEVRLLRDKTESRSAPCIATSGIIHVKTKKKRVLHDEIIVTSFTITPRAWSPLAFSH